MNPYDVSCNAPITSGSSMHNCEIVPRCFRGEFVDLQRLTNLALGEQDMLGSATVNGSPSISESIISRRKGGKKLSRRKEDHCLLTTARRRVDIHPCRLVCIVKKELENHKAFFVLNLYVLPTCWHNIFQTISATEIFSMEGEGRA